MSYWRKKPVVIEAFRWTGGPDQDEDPVWIFEAIRQRWVTFNDVNTDQVTMSIEAPEGTMVANRGDWIIKGLDGSLYPCRPDIFEATYEPVDP